MLYNKTNHIADCEINGLVMLNRKKRKTEMVRNPFQPYVLPYSTPSGVWWGTLYYGVIITFIVGWRDRRSFQMDNYPTVSCQGQVHYNLSYHSKER